MEATACSSMVRSKDSGNRTSCVNYGDPGETKCAKFCVLHNGNQYTESRAVLSVVLALENLRNPAKSPRYQPILSIPSHKPDTCVDIFFDKALGKNLPAVGIQVPSHEKALGEGVRLGTNANTTRTLESHDPLSRPPRPNHPTDVPGIFWDLAYVVGSNSVHHVFPQSRTRLFGLPRRDCFFVRDIVEISLQR